MMSLLLLISATLQGFAGEIPRVTSVILDLAKVYPVSISPGRMVKIEFPCPIVKQPTVGLPKHFSVSISADSNNQLDIHSLTIEKASTNLIVQCGRNVIVLDLIPDLINNRDFIRVAGVINGPVLQL